MGPTLTHSVRISVFVTRELALLLALPGDSYIPENVAKPTASNK